MPFRLEPNADTLGAARHPCFNNRSTLSKSNLTQAFCPFSQAAIFAVSRPDEKDNSIERFEQPTVILATTNSVVEGKLQCC